MSNNSWKQYGGLSKIDSLNSIKVGTVVADQIISRSSNPQYQLFNGTIEVTANLIADNDTLIGNSSFIKKDLFVTGNTYANNKLFFGGNQPLINDTSYVAFNVLPPDSSYSFIYGNKTNIGINTINPSAVFHITGYVQNLLTVETSFNSITNIIGQNKNKRGIVINASDNTSNICFYNDLSTNIKYHSNGDVSTNEPNAYIQYASGGILKLSTNKGIESRSKYSLINASGGIFLLDSSNTKLDSSGSILFNTSAGFVLTTSGGLIKLDSSINRILMNSSGDFVLNVSGGFFGMNASGGILSSKGSIVLNSSGGLVNVVSNNGNGNVIIDTSGAFLNARTSIISSFLSVTAPKYIGRGVSGEMYNATMTLYDNSNSTFLYDIYNDNSVKTGNALTIVAVDPSSNTFLRMVAPKNKMGAAFGGGVYPSDKTRSMTMIGLNDTSGNYISSQTIVSGKDPVKYFSTIGINTFSPKVDNYIMDINGPVHIGNGELHNFLNTNFEIKTTAFSRSHPKYGIITGSSSTLTKPYGYYACYTNDGGITWKQANIDITNVNETGYNLSEFDFSFTTSSMYDSSYGVIGSVKSFLFYTSNGGATWAKIQNYYKGTNDTDTIMRDTGSVKIVRYNNNLRFFNAYRYNNTIDPIMVDTYTKHIRYFDIDINQLSTELNGNAYGLKQFTDVESSINIVASDCSGSYIYFVGSGISKYSIADPSNSIYTNQKTDVSYNSIFTYSDNCVIAVGNNILSYTYDGSGWIDISTNQNNFAGIDRTNVILNSVYIYDASNAIASGNEGVIIYTNNGFNAQSWRKVPDEILNTNGIGGTNLTNTRNSLRFVNMPNKSSFVFTNVLSKYNNTTNYGTSYGTSYGNSNIIYGFLPNLLDRVNNRVFDVSGNMFLSGDVNVNDGGKIMSNNSNFYILNETVKNIYYGASMETLNIGNNDASTNIYGFTNISRSTHIQGDVSIDSRLFIKGDVSFNSRLIVNSDVSLNKRLWVGGDVSLSIRLFVGGDVSLNKRLYTSGDVSFNSRLSVLNDTSLNANFEVLGKSIMRDDVSMNKRLFVDGDVKMNSKLYVGSDASVNGDLEVFGKTILHDDIYIIETLVISGDVSMNSRLSVLSDVSLNAKFEVLGKSIIRDDISMNKRLFVGGDVSMNSRLSILSDVSLNKNLGVLGLAIFSNDVSLNRHLFVGRDVSLNKQLYVGGDVSMNSRLSVLSDTSLNGNFEVLGKSVLHDDIYVNRQIYIGDDVLFNSKGDYVLQKNLTTNSLNSTISTIVIDSFAIEWKRSSPSIVTNKINDWNNGWEGMSASISESGQYCIITASVKTLPTLAGIYYSTNYGEHWIQSNITNNAWIAKSSSSNGEYAIAIAWDVETITTNNVLLSSNYGITWVPPTQNLNIQDSKLDTSISGTGQYAIIGSLLYSSDYGNTWKDTVGGSNSSYCVISYSGQYALSGTYGNGIGSLLFSTNYGKNWITPIYSITNNTISGAWTGLSYPSGNNSSYAIGSNGSGMYYSTNYGYSWTQSNLTTGSFVTSSMSSTGQYAITGIKRSSDYYISSSYGVNWNYISNSQLYFINNSFAMSGTGQYIIYAGQNGIFYQNNIYTGLIGLGTTPNYPIDINGFTRITGDVSMNSRLYVGSDTSLKSRLFVVGDVSMNSKLSILSDVSINKNIGILGTAIFANDVSMNSRLFVGGDVSMNSKLSILSDVSINRNFEVIGNTILHDVVTMNSELFVGGNVIFYKDVEFAGGFTLPSINFSDDTTFKDRIFVLEDVSFNKNLFVLGDVSFNNKLMVNGDASFNKKLIVNGDVSLNGNVTINGDNLYLNNKYLALTTINVVNDSILNKRLLVSGDVSLNRRLYVSDDVSFNKNLAVLGSAFFVNDVSITKRLYIGGDVSLNSNVGVLGKTIFSNDVLINSNLDVVRDVVMKSRLYVYDDMFISKRLFTNKIDLSTNVLSITALSGSNSFSNYSPGFSGGLNSNSVPNVPNFNIYFSSNNSNSINPSNNLDFYIDNPRNNLVLGQYLSTSSIYNIYNSSSSGQTSSYFENNLAISSNALNSINTTYDSTNNIALGYNSLAYLNSGHCNTSIGSYSMSNLGSNSSSGNTYTLPNNNYYPNSNSDSVTSNFNTSIGFFSMSSKNINTTSNKNTVLGALAFADTISNVSSSVSRGIYTQNTFIGYNTQPMSGVFSNQIVLGTTTETTYIPGKLSVLNDTSFNGKVFVNGDLSLNGRITFSKNAFSNGSIPLFAIADLANSVTSAVASSSSQILSSIQASTVVPTTIPLDGHYNFGKKFQEKNNTANTWTNLAMSMTGEYQTALDIAANIYYSNDFGETWNQATVNFPSISIKIDENNETLINSDNYNTSNLFYGIALAITYSGKIQIASINLRDVNDNNEDVQSYIFLSCDYGSSWNCVYQNNNPKSAQISSLATSSDGSYMYAAVYRTNPYLYSSDFGVSWSCPTTNNVQVNGNWKAVATSSNGQYVCFGGDQTGIYFSNNGGVQMSMLLANKYVNSISMSYSGQYTIVATGNFTPQMPYGTVITVSTSSKYNDYLYLSSNFGNLFFAISGPPASIWLIVKISGNGQYMIAITESDNSGDPGNPGSLWYSYNFGQTWFKNNIYTNRFWSGAAISSTGQYLTLTSPFNNILTSFTPDFNGSFSNTLSTNNMNISGLLNITGTSAPISLFDGSVLTTANSPLDYSNNFGTNWNIYASTNSYKSIAMSLTGQYQSAVSIYNGTSYGNIYISNNYGINWYNPTIYITTNTGSTYNNTTGLGWQNITVSGSGQYQYAIPVNTNYIYSKYIYSSTNYGNSWFILNDTDDVNWTCISCSSSGQYIIAGNKLNYLFLSSSYGIYWNATCNINISNPLKYWNSVSISSSGQYIYAASVSTQSSPNNENRDNIYISNDFGTSWISIQNSSTNNYWQSITCSSDGQYVYAVSSSDYNLTKINDGIYISNDYGNSFAKTNALNSGWKCISCSSSGKYVIAVSQTYTDSQNNTNGNIYISIDFGNKWSSSSGNTWSSVSTSSLFNGCAISSDGMYLTVCSSTNIYNSVTPYSYIGVSNNFYSYGNNLLVGDVSMNSRLSVRSDVSLNKNFEVLGNSIFRKDVSIYGKLNVNNYQANTIITTSTTNYTMIIAEDLSINGVINVKQPEYRQATMSLINTANNSAIKIRGDLDRFDALCIGLWGDTFGDNSTGYIQTIIDGESAVRAQAYPLVLNPNGGNVGIATTAPTFNLDVTGTIRATGQITGNSFNAVSDQRIKTNINEISGKFALDTLRNINPVSYHFIDDSKQKSSMGFIAQHIQTSLENSVSKQTNYIPNIYENIDINGKTISLNNKFTSDISLCDYPVKLQFKDLSNNTLYGTIDKIIDSKTFLLTKSLDTSLNKLFLYGQEVDDFLSINYDTIFTVVTGAVKQLDVELQETKQIVKDQSDTINELRTELSELKTQMSNIIRYLNNK